MKKKLAHLGLVMAFALAGCSVFERMSGGASTGSGPCQKQGNDICVVTVNATSCSSISVSPDIAIVGPNDAGDVVWNVPGRLRFARDGIVFKHPHSDFSNPRGGGSAEFRYNNAHRVRNKGHPYTVNLMDGNTACPPYDPSIMN